MRCSGTGEVPRIVEAIDAALERTPAKRGAAPCPSTFHRQPPRFGIDLPEYLYDADTPRRLATPGHYAYLKIAEGCDYKCAFCIIPKMRGHYRSRTDRRRSCSEARALAARGVKELLLISQDTTFYGIDRKERGALPRLLRELNAVDGLEWIRLLYLYPTTISDEVIDAIAECDKVCKYIDLPLQHASDRGAAADEAAGHPRAATRSCSPASATASPGVTLRTTFIVGFPGETDAGLRRADRASSTTVGFDHVGVFTYSHEEGTTALRPGRRRAGGDQEAAADRG